MYEDIKKQEQALYKKALNYVRTQMDSDMKDRFYKISIGQVGWEIKKETLPTEKYNELRDNFIAKDLTYYSLLEDVTDFDKETIKRFSRGYFKAETAGHYQANAIKALEDNFQEQTAAILAITGESKLDSAKMQYLGSKTYSYAGIFLISFENSPASVEVRYLIDY